MNNRERVNAILNYEKVDRMPVVSFGYWNETLEKWFTEKHISRDEWQGYVELGDNSDADNSVMKKLGFDFNWNACFGPNAGLMPQFDTVVLHEYPDGKQKVIDHEGLIVIVDKNIVSIPAEIGTTLTDRKSWEELYLPKLQYSADRINIEASKKLVASNQTRDLPLGLFCGSLLGKIRNWLGVEGLSYLYVDDEDLFIEIIDTVGNMSYKVVQATLELGINFDYAHFWEDICFKNGPLVVPSVFDKLVGPHYKKITKLLNSHDINIISVDCDGLIDMLMPTWIESGVNTMFPIEVGTWHASIVPWREKYGKELRGVGGMNKTLFARDKKAIDEEVKRLKKMVNLGGYIPCPDHRIPPDAKFELVQYYCDRMQNLAI